MLQVVFVGCKGSGPQPFEKTKPDDVGVVAKLLKGAFVSFANITILFLNT